MFIYENNFWEILVHNKIGTYSSFAIRLFDKANSEGVLEFKMWILCSYLQVKFLPIQWETR